MNGAKKRVEIHHGLKGGKGMIYWNPKKIKELKEKGLKIKIMTLKEYNLTNKQKCDKENNNEKIQNKNIWNGNRRSSSDAIRQRARYRNTRE